MIVSALMRGALFLSLTVACSHPAPTPGPIPPAASVGSASVGHAPAPTGEPAPPPPRRLVERFACAQTRNPIVEFHHAELNLYNDGGFELRHINTDPDAGEQTLLRGRYKQLADRIILEVTEGDRRRWRGDEHRFTHGEDVPYCAWTEPVSGAPRVLSIVADARGRRVHAEDFRTDLYATAEGVEPPACADVRPERAFPPVRHGVSDPCQIPRPRSSILPVYPSAGANAGGEH
jgi:hypothetical protein